MDTINDKHLAFIQDVINRHNSNSFKIKGWAITITAAIFALTGAIKEPFLCFIAFGPVIMFWVLDSIYLANERCFVSLYSCVSNNNKLSIKKEELKPEIQLVTIEDFKEFSVKDYSMNFEQFREIKRNNCKAAFISKTIVWFYLALAILTFLTFWGLKSIRNSIENVPLKIDATIQNSGHFKIDPIEINSKTISLDTLKITEIPLTKSILKSQQKKK